MPDINGEPTITVGDCRGKRPVRFDWDEFWGWLVVLVGGL